MNEPLRIFLRSVGLVLFVGGVAGILFFLAAGPERVAEMMGTNCKLSTTKHDVTSVCSWKQALDIFKELPLAIFLGALMLVLLRRESDKTTPVRGRAATIGVSLIVATVLLSAVGTQVYAKGYVAVQTYRDTKEILEAPRPMIERPGNARPAAQAKEGPQGLGPGSLLRRAAFRRSLVELRRLAPPGGRVSELRVAPDRIDAEVVTQTQTVALRKPWNAGARVVSTGGAAPADRGLVGLDDVDTRAPRRIASGTARMHRADVGRFDYAVLHDVGGLRWNGFLADGRQVRAALDGGQIQRLD